MTTRSASFSSDLNQITRNSDTVRIAQIGLAGGIGYVHVNEYANNPHFQLVGGYDLYPNEPKVADAIARILKMGGKYYPSFEAVLADPKVEAVDICTPHHFHRPMAIAAMKAGKHVIVEKPMAPHPEDIAAMLDAQISTGRIGAVQMQHVGRSSMLKLREQLQAGAIGQIKEVFLSSLWWRKEDYYSRGTWPGRMKIDGKWCIDGALFNQCIHYITEMLILTSTGPLPAVAKVKDVNCAMYKFHEAPTLESGDTAFVTGIIDVPDQPKLTMIGTTCSTEERHQIDIIGTKGRALWNGAGYVFVNGEAMQEFHDDNEVFDGTSRIFNSFAEAIRGRGKPLTDWAALQNTTKFIYDCYQSSNWAIKKAPWEATATLFGDVFRRVCLERKLPGNLKTPPSWA